MRNRLTKYLSDFSSLKLTRSASDRLRLFEIAAVILTGIGKFIFMDYLNWRLPFVIVAIVSWTVYVYYRFKKNKSVLKDWGFRRDNLKPVLQLTIPFAIIAVGLFFITGYLQGTINLTWHIFPLILTYPLWGIIQQFLTIGLIAGNLNDFKSIRLNKNLVILLTAVVFSVVHYPSIWLMIGTFVLALFYGYVYLKAKNIYVLGILHGWLGALFYYTVVGQDPFADIFLKYF